MATVKAFIRSGKKEGFVNVRFRLSDGRGIQFFHKSEILVIPSIWDTKKEQYKAKVIIPTYCKGREEFYKDVTDRKNLIIHIYTTQKVESSEQLNYYIDKALNPDKYKEKPCTLLNRLCAYTENCYKEGIFGYARKKHYDVLSRELNRFLIINNISDVVPIDFTSENIVLFRDFLINEYAYVDKYRGLYIEMNNRNTPIAPRGQNTVATKLKKLQAFFNELEGNDEIPVSPFRKLGRQRKTVMMREQYDEPICLTKIEFKKIQNTNVPEALQETKDAFLLHCNLGCRIGDFQSISMDNIAEEEEGIYYVHYLPSKTAKEGDMRKEIRTPILPFSMGIIKKYNLKFNIINYTYGERGYNDKIKELLKYCEIKRMVPVYNEQEAKNEYIPLYDTGSSKLARKTHVDLMNKVQIDKYVAGLHSRNSTAVNRYTVLGIKERYVLMCAAFGCDL